MNIFISPGKGRRPVSRSYRKGAFLYQPADAATEVFFLAEGRVKTGLYGESGREITKAVLGAGAIVGELSLIGEDSRRDFACAMEDTRVFVLTVETMNDLLQENADLNLFLLRLIGKRLLEVEQRLESLIFKNSRTRVIEFLYDLGRDHGQRVGFEMLVRNFFTHQEIANLTTTSRQTVTTVLNDLRSDNVITFNRRRLLIRDMERLKQKMD